MLAVRALVVIAFLCQALTALAQSQSPPKSSSPRREPPPMVVKAGAPLWERYLAAGEEARRKKDDASAKRYWLGSLAELEKTKKGSVGRWGRLQHRLLEIYPRDWSDSKLDEASKIKQEEEQVQLYDRINKLNQRFGSTGLAAQVSMSRSKQARDQLAKAKEERKKTATPAVDR